MATNLSPPWIWTRSIWNRFWTGVASASIISKRWLSTETLKSACELDWIRRSLVLAFGLTSNSKGWERVWHCLPGAYLWQSKNPTPFKIAGLRNEAIIYSYSINLAVVPRKTNHEGVTWIGWWRCKTSIISPGRQLFTQDECARAFCFLRNQPRNPLISDRFFRIHMNLKVANWRAHSWYQSLTKMHALIFISSRLWKQGLIYMFCNSYLTKTTISSSKSFPRTKGSRVLCTMRGPTIPSAFRLRVWAFEWWNFGILG
jgi:hypothetical protein